MKFYAERKHLSSYQQLQINKMAKRPKLKIDQILKIRTFFQSARRADSKNAKKMKKVYFLKIFFIENLLGVTQPLKIFV